VKIRLTGEVSEATSVARAQVPAGGLIAAER
jgi:hypothetical protein